MIATAKTVSLVSPFPPEHYSLLWAWMCQFPECNLDDSGPHNAAELGESIARRERNGTVVWEVLHDGEPVGAIGYRQESAMSGGFDGICFAQKVHGSGVALAAVGQVLEMAFAGTVSRVFAAFPETNTRVAAFLRKLGAVEEFRVESEKRHNGKLFMWQLMRISVDAFRSVQGLAIDQKHNYHSGVVQSVA